MRVFFFFSLKEVIWVGLHAFWLGNVPTGAALATCLSHGDLCLNLGNMPHRGFYLGLGHLPNGKVIFPNDGFFQKILFIFSPINGSDLGKPA